MYPKVRHREEALREGMQIEDVGISSTDKVRLLDALSETGLKEINVGSFVSSTWTPQMANIEEVVKGFTPKPGVKYTYLALNERGHERAKEYMPPLEWTDIPTTSVDMCDVFAQRNGNVTQAQQIARWPIAISRARLIGATDVGIKVTNPWGSNWVGAFQQSELMRMLDRQHKAWTEEGFNVTTVKLADAMSWNMPHQVEQAIREIKDRWPAVKTFDLHLHNGRGVALISVYVALNVLDPEDTLRLQSSIGGMAGCPACGNGRGATMIPTEDLIHMLDSMGIYTGVDLYKLVQAVWLAEEIVGHSLFGAVSRIGPRPEYERRYPMDMPLIETLDQAKHFIEGPSSYAGANAPWNSTITSWQRQ